MRRLWALAALGIVLAACGGEQPPDRLDLRTPGARTGEPPPTATPTPPPVTRAERRVLRGWPNSVRSGHITEAAAYFSLPTEITDVAAGSAQLRTRAEVEKFNRGLPCGTKLLRAHRGPSSFVVGTFRLSERKGACGASAGHTIAVAFEIIDGHITRWMRDAASLGVPPDGG